MCTRSQISSQNMQGANTTTVHVSLVRVLWEKQQKAGSAPTTQHAGFFIALGCI